MKVRVQLKGLKAPYLDRDVQSVVVYDEFDNPVLAAQQIDQSTIVAEKAGQASFGELLKSVGIGLSNSVYRVFKRS